MNKRTPGPWKVTPDGYIAAQGFVPIRTPFRKDAFVDGPIRSDHPEEELQANAHLIAVAPEMLEALKDLTATARTFRNVPKEDQEWTLTDDATLDAAFAVIAKAEGKP